MIVDAAPRGVNLMRVVLAIDKAASCRVNKRHRAESFRGKLLVQQMFARAVRVVGPVAPSGGAAARCRHFGDRRLDLHFDLDRSASVAAVCRTLCSSDFSCGRLRLGARRRLVRAALSHRVTVGDVLLTAERMTPSIWIGLAGLTTSGVFLKPDLNSWLVVVKLCCVVGIGIVGVLAGLTSRLMERQMPTSRSLIHRGMVLAGASQSFGGQLSSAS